MYAQLVEGGTTPDRRTQMDRIVTDEMVPALQDEPGFAGALNLVDREQRQRDDDHPLGAPGAGRPRRSPTTAARS